MAVVLKKIWGLGSVLSLSVDELVVQDGGCKFMLRTIISLVLHTNHTALTKDLAVLLSGDFLRHLEDHLDQGVFGKALWACEQDARLAQVLDDPLAPGTEVL